jgi:hypothetical protein
MTLFIKPSLEYATPLSEVVSLKSFISHPAKASAGSKIDSALFSVAPNWRALSQPHVAPPSYSGEYGCVHIVH